MSQLEKQQAELDERERRIAERERELRNSQAPRSKPNIFLCRDVEKPTENFLLVFSSFEKLSAVSGLVSLSALFLSGHQRRDSARVSALGPISLLSLARCAR